MSFGEIIRQRREQLGLTQDQVAMAAGISKPYLSNIETGRASNPPTDGVLTALEKALQFQRTELTRFAHLARTPSDVREEHELLEAEVQKLRSVIRELIHDEKSTSRRDVDLAELARSIQPDSNVRRLSAGVAVPVINKVSAGYPQNFTDLDYPPFVAEEYIRCPDLHDGQAFATRVVGDSMEPEYHEGDIVVFSPNTPAKSGDDCFVRFDGDDGTTFKRFYEDDAHTIRLQPLNSKYPAAQYDRERINGLWPAVFRIQRIR